MAEDKNSNSEEKNDNKKEETSKNDNSEKKLDFASFGKKILNMTIRLIVYSIVGGCFVYLTNIVNDAGGLGGTETDGLPYVSPMGLFGCDQGIKKSMQKGFKKFSDMSKKMMDKVPLSEDMKKKASSKLDSVGEKLDVNKGEGKGRRKKEKVPFSVYVKHSLEEWSFPYKNQVLCNKQNIYYEPLHYRFIRWFTSTLTLSYAYGRKGLDALFETLDNEKYAFWFGPLAVYLIVYLSPIYGVASHGLGSIINIGKLIPRFIFQFWFPIITFVLAFFAMPIISIGGGIVQALMTIFFFVIYPFMETEKFPMKVNDVMKDFSGPMYIWKNITSRTKYLITLFFIFVTKYAFEDLNIFYALGGGALTLMTYFF
jgi:hypothetical protein